MRVLAPDWLGSDGSAAWFGRHVGGRIVPGLNLFVETTDGARAAHGYIAITYEAIVTNATWLIDYHAVRFAKTTFQAVEVCLDQYRELGEFAVETIDTVIALVEFTAAGS